MSGKDRANLAELERALRRGPAHTREETGRADGEAANGGRAQPSGAARERDAREARAAAQRFSAGAAERGLVDVNYGQVDSPFGPLLLAATREGLLRLAFPEEDADAVLQRLAERVSPRIVQAPAQLDAMRRELDEYFAGRRRHFELPLDWTLVGPFGRRVLGAAAQIPYGERLTYKQVAAQAGSPRGSRAAGNALATNPIPIVVPCHRVLRSGGALGGYAGGLERKRFLLELEQSQSAR